MSCLGFFLFRFCLRLVIFVCNDCNQYSGVKFLRLLFFHDDRPDRHLVIVQLFFCPPEKPPLSRLYEYVLRIDWNEEFYNQRFSKVLFVHWNHQVKNNTQFFCVTE